MPLPLLDTNVILRHVLQDDPIQSPKATAVLRRIEAQLLRVRITDLVVFEAVFSLQRRERVPRFEIRDKLLALLELEGIVLPGKRRWTSVLHHYVRSGLSFADSYHVVMMNREAATEIISFDTDFDGIPGITRIEP